MGRQQYLTRLLLGRSPYEDVPDEHITPIEPAQIDASNPVSKPPHDGGDDDDATTTPLSNGATQQYDSKGRPINAETEAQYAELRRAQNDILALIGVVEKQDADETKQRSHEQLRRQARTTILAREHERGDDLGFMVTLAGLGPTWWVDYLLHRIIVGKVGAGVGANNSFIDILTYEWSLLRHASSLGGFYAVAWPGVAADVTYLLARTVLAAGVEHGISYLQNLVRRLGFSKRTTKRLHDGLLPFVCEIIMFGLEIWLLPLKQWSVLQQLHILPAVPLLPPRQVFYRHDPRSFSNWMWLPAFSRFTMFTYACSPAGMTLLADFLSSYNDDFADAPILHELTDFRYPEINSAFRPPQSPSISRDPAGWLLHKLYSVRERAMRWFGWKIERNDPILYLDRYEDDINPEPADDKQSNNWKADETTFQGRVQRSTALAHMTPTVLAQSIDGFLARLVMLPFTTAVLRSTAQGFLRWPMAPAFGALDSPEAVIGPFQAGLVAQAIRSGGAADDLVRLKAYASHLGLANLLCLGVQAGIVGSTYALARWQGVSMYGWGVGLP
ncbi:hypothetical protein K431DRAFT_280827 [Polychaeton citri CBS 116435]|uniref:Uncharacterized protein n=1 Tax=Polychaeton citri CBS 116435 TaxID=1314669 RepID=A0A9P4QFG6_9PEZI|nr:hypothetical protein K431DRAFT_280827 [Polychaeton citri CBS 116435]